MRMMKRFMLFSIFCLVAFAGRAQHSNKELLTMKAWKIQSDEMSGLGVHTSLPRDTELHFFADGTWKSSQPIMEVSGGTWQLENKERNLVMKSGDEKIKYLILHLTEKELQYRLKKSAATYTYKWLSVE